MWTSLIGFMASGKSTVAKRLRAATRRPTAHVDEIIVAAEEAPLDEIFGAGGEARFRELELGVLRELPADRHLVVDCGGGVVETPEAARLLRRRGVVLWLDVPWDTVRTRLKDGPTDQRPLVDRLGWAGLEELYRRRRRLYARWADFRLLGGEGKAEDLARVAMLRGLLWQRRGEGESRCG